METLNDPLLPGLSYLDEFRLVVLPVVDLFYGPKLI